MTGNKSYLTDYKEINGGFVAFGGNSKGRKITGKGKIKTGKLDFKDVYFVKKLKFNLFSVSQMCDKKNIALFTDTACVVLSSDFKLTGESHVLLKVHRKDNMYSVELKNDSPSAGFKISMEEEKKNAENTGNKDSEVPGIKEPRVTQEKDANVNNTNNINTVSPTDNVVEIGKFSDAENDDSSTDINNMESTFQMDVKSVFLYGKIKEEVYVFQPSGFEDPNFPDKVYKVEKALYGLHQAPRA
nr:ribonuclease H-like domain-containing protein [Tanacetum cinerariifolium]